MSGRILLLADNTNGKIESYLDLITFENLTQDEFYSRVRSGFYPEYRMERRGEEEYPVSARPDPQ